MTQQIQQTLRDNPAARWGALAIVSITMACGYFLTDVISPLESILTGSKGWSSEDYGFFSGAYGYINVFLFMLFFGGIILEYSQLSLCWLVLLSNTMHSKQTLEGKWY